MKKHHHVQVPFPTPTPSKDALYKFKFQTPSSVKLVGAYGLKAAAKHPKGITIDVSVLIPDVPLVLVILNAEYVSRERLS